MKVRTDVMRVLSVAGTPVSALSGLDSDGFERVTASGVEEALAVLSDGDVDCVVATYDLPGGSGVDLLRRVRSDRDSLPVVLLAVDGDARVANEAFAAGASDYFPVDPGIDQRATLRARVESAVEQYRLRRATTDDDERLSWFIEQSPFGVIEWTPDLEIRRANDAAVDILGYDEGELAGFEWEHLIPSDDHEMVGDVTDRLRRAEGGFHSVNENVRKDGRRVVCEWHNRVVTDDSGDTIAIFSQFRDVTERIERELTLQQLHEASRELVSADTREGVAEIIIEAVRDTLGYDNNAVRLVSDDGTELRPVAMTAGISEVLGDRPVYPVGEGTAGRAFADGETLLYDDIQTIDDGYDREGARAGMYLPIGTHGTLSITDPEPGVFDQSDVQLAEVFAANAAVALDKILRTQHLERQNERLDKFASVLSHDLQSPLNVAIGRTELAREECDSDHLDAVAHAHDRMRELTRDLLKLAREGDATVHFEPVQLSDIVDDCWRHVETTSATVDVEPDGVICADRSRTSQLLENLFRNAVEHGGEQVTVTAGLTDCGFFVEDDGPGIPTEKRERAFESGYSTEVEGTGFGLSIVATIVEEHGWSIRTTEGESGGARFQVTGVDVDTSLADGE